MMSSNRIRKFKEQDKPVTLKVYTKCPKKWLLIDQETGEIYTGKSTVKEGDNGWEKLTKTK